MKIEVQLSAHLTRPSPSTSAMISDLTWKSENAVADSPRFAKWYLAKLIRAMAEEAILQIGPIDYPEGEEPA